MSTFYVIYLPTCQRINVHSLTLLARGRICGQIGGVDDEGMAEQKRARRRGAPLAAGVWVVFVDQPRPFVGFGAGLAGVAFDGSAQ